MHKAERLFQLVLLLRGGQVRTAHYLARKLEISGRTIYRDVDSLTLAGVPIDGEAGVGYRIRAAWQLPPMMFDSDEARALNLGVRMVRAWADPALKRATGRVLEKVDAVAPPEVKETLSERNLVVPDFFVDEQVRTRMQLIRESIEVLKKLHLDYMDVNGNRSQRTVRPLALIYWGASWTMNAWCELREDFRDFRLGHRHRADRSGFRARTRQDRRGPPAGGEGRRRAIVANRCGSDSRRGFNVTSFLSVARLHVMRRKGIVWRPVADK